MKCHHYWPSEGSRLYGVILVELIEEGSFGDYISRKFKLTHTEVCHSVKKKNTGMYCVHRDTTHLIHICCIWSTCISLSFLCFLGASLSFCLSFPLFVCPFVLSVCLSFYLSVFLVCLFVCFFVLQPFHIFTISYQYVSFGFYYA